MTAEQFLQNLDLSDALILESSPENFREKRHLLLRQVLTIGSVAAAVILCVTIGLTRFRSTQPGGPSVQLPAISTVTDTQTTESDTVVDDTRAMPPHFHYKGKIYQHAWNSPQDGITEIPADYLLIGKTEFRDACLNDPKSHAVKDDMSLYGTHDGSDVYMDEAELRAYVDDGNGVFWPYELYVASETPDLVLFETQSFEWNDSTWFASLRGRISHWVPDSATPIGRTVLRKWDFETGKLTDETMEGDIYLSKSGNAIYFVIPEDYEIPKDVYSYDAVSITFRNTDYE